MGTLDAALSNLTMEDLRRIPEFAHQPDFAENIEPWSLIATRQIYDADTGCTHENMRDRKPKPKNKV